MLDLCQGIVELFAEAQRVAHQLPPHLLAAGLRWQCDTSQRERGTYERWYVRQVKSDPTRREEFLAQRREEAKRWWERTLADPERLEKARDRVRRAQERKALRLQSDPVAMEKHRARRREYQAAYRAAKRAARQGQCDTGGMTNEVQH